MAFLYEHETLANILFLLVNLGLLSVNYIAFKTTKVDEVKDTSQEATLYRIVKNEQANQDF